MAQVPATSIITRAAAKAAAAAAQAAGGDAVAPTEAHAQSSVSSGAVLTEAVAATLASQPVMNVQSQGAPSERTAGLVGRTAKGAGTEPGQGKVERSYAAVLNAARPAGRMALPAWPRDRHRRRWNWLWTGEQHILDI